jgi:hypothetical protein
MDFDQKKRRNAKQLLVLFLFAFALSTRYYVGIVNCLNTTQYAFSYKYGLISRGFLGSVVRLVNWVFSINLLNYDGMVQIAMFLNTLYLLVLFIFFWKILSRIPQSLENRILVLFYVFGIFAFPEYLTEENFGRSDICLVMITLICCFLLLKEKGEWLILPLIAVAMAIHQGYILMFFHVVLVILFVRCFDKEGKEKRKYQILFVSGLLLAVVLLFYFNFFSHQTNMDLYDEIYDNASSYAHDGVVQYNLILHEIFGISPAQDEWDEHIHNFVEFPVFFALMLPYLISAFRFFRNVLREAQGKEKLKYLAVAFGAATILPDLIVKIDYGRWMFSIIFYYFIIIAMLLAMGDPLIRKHFDAIVDEMKKKPYLVVVLLGYPILFTPLEDVNICDMTRMIVDHFIPSIY